MKIVKRILETAYSIYLGLQASSISARVKVSDAS